MIQPQKYKTPSSLTQKITKLFMVLVKFKWNKIPLCPNFQIPLDFEL
jgi:hypothetical protein